MFKQSLEGLIDIIKINYTHMGRYMEALLSNTHSFFNLMGANSDDEELREIAGYSIEIWNTLCEEEQTNQRFCLIKSSQAQDGQHIWKGLAQMLFEGVKMTGFDLEHDHSVDDDGNNSFSAACAQGLRFLAQVIGDEMLDMTVAYVSGILDTNT